jgi:TRAP-type C4-dicarboxylate transport system substrate-binding protein
MPRIPRSPTAVAFVLYRTWVKLPPEQRRQLLEAARKHGPQLAAKAAGATKKAAAARRGPV